MIQLSPSLRTLLPLAVVALSLHASSAHAASIKMDTFHSGAGGNYSFLPIAGLDTSTYTHKDSSGWIGTFCLEKNEYFTPNGTYDVALSSGAKNGGVDNHDPTNTPNFDPISDGTAFLYERFALGTLASDGFSYTNSSLSLQLQNMIWFLEDEQNTWGSPNIFSNLLLTKYGATWESLAKASYAGSAVQVMNLTTNGGRDRHQDQLYYSKTEGDLRQVPEGGATLGLLSLSVLGLGLVARNYRVATGATAN